jgi:hypothetical protein
MVSPLYSNSNHVALKDMRSYSTLFKLSKKPLETR